MVNDKRPYPPYSWGWLNRFAEQLFWDNDGAHLRPQYAWGTVFAAAQSRALGFRDVSVVEFGVAGGTGLLALQAIARDVSHEFGVGVRVYGFDTGAGLPSVTDIRDLPQLYGSGDYCMDHSALRPRLKPETTLVIGDIKQTIEEFLVAPHPPVGFVSLDVDLYTSTDSALRLFRGDIPLAHCLPRVVCYLDDIMGSTFAEITGERLAMKEYNEQEYPTRGISPVYGLRYSLGWPHCNARWPDMMFWAHFLDNPKYAVHDGLAPIRQAPVTKRIAAAS